MTKYIQVITAVDSRKNAAQIARKLVEKRLAACVQIVGPIQSTYRWKGRIEHAAEWLCLIKTRRDRYPKVERALRAVHPYEVPEILAVPVSMGGRSYLRWLDKEL